MGQRHELKVRVAFEPGRRSAADLAAAYEEVAPVVRRSLSSTRLSVSAAVVPTESTAGFRVR